MQLNHPARTPAILLLLPGLSAARILNDEKLSKVPKQLRVRLVERLNLYFQYRRAKEYEKLNGLTSVESMIGTDKLTLNDFVRREQERDGRFTLTNWRLECVSKDSGRKNGQAYLLGVKAVIGYKKGGTDEVDIHLDARIEDGDWFFREYRIGGW